MPAPKKPVFIKTILSSVLICLIHTPYAYAKHTEQEYTSAIAKTIQYVDANQSAVWPGFHLSSYPLIINMEDFSGNTHNYAYQFSPKDTSLWKKLTIESMPVYYRENLLSDPDQGFRILDDQRVLVWAIIPMMNNEPNYEISTATKYLFKDYQFHQSTFPVSALNTDLYPYDGFNNIENIALINIERAILNEYLTNKNMDALKNYLAVHQTRLTALSKENRDFENALELSSGTQTYVSLKASYTDDQSYTKEALSFYPGSICATPTDPFNIMRCLTTTQYGFIDLALGYALDKVTPLNWKKLVETNGVSFSTLTSSFVPMDANEINQRVEHAKAQYQFDQKVAELNKNIKSYLEDLQAQQTKSKQQPGYNVSFDTRGCSSLMPSSYDGYYHINTQSTLMTNYKARYLCDGDNYRMNALFDYAPFVYSSSDMATLKLMPETMLTVDGKQETVESYIKTGKKTTFHRLLIENQRFMLRINGLEGVLDGSNNQIIMKLTSQSLPKMKSTLAPQMENAS